MESSSYALGAAALTAAAGLCWCSSAPKTTEYLDESTTSVPVVGRGIVAGSGSASPCEARWGNQTFSFVRDGAGRSCDSAEHEPTKRLVRPAHTTPPAKWHLTPNLDAKGPLSKEQVKSFFDDGYVFLPEWYSKAALDAVRLDVESMINNLAIRLHRAGKIEDLYEGLDWTSRLLRMRQDFPDAPVILIKGGVLPVSLQKMFSDPKMLDIANQLGVGPDVALNAAWNLRGKMPSHEETVVPWHQDNSYWEPRVWDEQVLTVWVALVDATTENGCMEMMKGGHTTGKTATHTIGTSTSTWYTEVSEQCMAQELLGKSELVQGVDKIIVEAKAGGVLIFPGTTPHRSLNSRSKNIRWSTDFRLHPKTAKRPGKGGELDWFYGLKDSLLLRDGSNPAHKPDWSEWATVDRTEVQDAAGLGKVKAEEAKENFDPRIVGPWMDLWDLETDLRGLPNAHIDLYLEEDDNNSVHQTYIKKGAGFW